MKIRRVGRRRPIFHRGKCSVPNSIVKRLAVSKNHLILAEIANFNGKVDQYYLTIDNILSSVIIAKEGTLTTLDHRIKIDKFLKHLRRRCKIRYIYKDDLTQFYVLWKKSRYSLYFPNSSEVKKMRLFTSHLLDFAITELARFYKSDETLLDQKIGELIKVYHSESILEEAADIHEYHQMTAEHWGDLYGGKLSMKLANPWNFVDVSLLTDQFEISQTLDKSKKAKEILYKSVKIWDELINCILLSNFKRIVMEIADAKIKKKGINQEKAIEESIDLAVKHPKLQKFRLILNFTYDSVEFKKEAESFSTMIKAAMDMIKNENTAVLNGWEIYKKYER